MRLLDLQRDDLEAPLFCVYIRWGAERMRSLDLSALLASASASASAVAFCRQAAWRHGAIGCRTMSSFRNICNRGGAEPNKPLSSCLQGLRCVVNVKLLGV